MVYHRRTGCGGQAARTCIFIEIYSTVPAHKLPNKAFGNWRGEVASNRHLHRNPRPRRRPFTDKQPDVGFAIAISNVPPPMSNEIIDARWKIDYHQNVINGAATAAISSRCQLKRHRVIIVSENWFHFHPRTHTRTHHNPPREGVLS